MVAQPRLDPLEAAGAEQPRQQPLSLARSSARRNAWNRPCGSIATWQNWSRFIPSRPETRSPASSSRLVRARPTRRPTRSTSVTRAWLAGRRRCRASWGAPRRGSGRTGTRRPPTLTLERHPRCEPRRRLVGAQAAGVLPVAGHRAVQREADGVEHARLPGAGGAGQQEQPGGGELVEVDLRGVDEGPEGRDRQLVEPHQPSPAAPRRARRRPGRRHSRRTRAAAARTRRQWPARRAWARRSRARPRGRCGRARARPTALRGSPAAGANASTRACGKRVAQPLHRPAPAGRRR